MVFLTLVSEVKDLGSKVALGNCLFFVSEGNELLFHGTPGECK